MDATRYADRVLDRVEMRLQYDPDFLAKVRAAMADRLARQASIGRGGLRGDLAAVRRFIAAECVADEQATVPSAELFTRFQRWALANNAAPMGAVSFGKALKRLMPSVIKTRPGARGSRAWSYAGIRLR